jgi:hypothetical protein
MQQFLGRVWRRTRRDVHAGRRAAAPREGSGRASPLLFVLLDSDVGFVACFRKPCASSALSAAVDGAVEIAQQQDSAETLRRRPLARAMGRSGPSRTRGRGVQDLARTAASFRRCPACQFPWSPARLSTGLEQASIPARTLILLREREELSVKADRGGRAVTALMSRMSPPSRGAMRR